MEYIYNGKVEMYQADIENFINVAQKLRVEGLDALEEDPNISETLEEVNDYVPDTKSEKRKNPIRKKQAEPFRSSIVSLTNAGDVSSDLNELYTKNGDIFECIKCERTTKKSSDIRRHVEIHIEGLSFECPLYCGSTFRSRMQLKDHKRKCN